LQNRPGASILILQSNDTHSGHASCWLAVFSQAPSAIFAPFLEGTASILDTKTGAPVGKTGQNREKSGIQGRFEGPAAKVLTWHCRCYESLYDEYN
jgi:hypothetical protein